jgi:hypothetical protein
MEVPSEAKVVEEKPTELTDKATFLFLRDGSTPRLLFCDTTVWYQVQLEVMT